MAKGYAESMSNGFQGPGEVAAVVSDKEECLVRELIRKLVGDIAPPGSPAVQPGHILREELGFDSVREAEFTFVLEELFGLESLLDEDTPGMETVGDLEDFTLGMIAQGRAKVPTRDEIERMESLVGESARRTAKGV